jgi:hypothetical protein
MGVMGALHRGRKVIVTTKHVGSRGEQLEILGLQRCLPIGA